MADNAETPADMKEALDRALHVADDHIAATKAVAATLADGLMQHSWKKPAPEIDPENSTNPQTPETYTALALAGALLAIGGLRAIRTAQDIAAALPELPAAASE